MGSFGSISLANKFVIVLGSLIAIAFGAGFIKLWVIKRRLRKHVEKDEEMAKNPRIETKHTGRENDPRYLFGVRAIEKGHFGGVAQTSRPNSIAPSVALSSSNPSSNDVANSSNSQLSINVLPMEQTPEKKKPSALSFRPSDSLQDGPKTHSPSSPGSRYVVSPVTPSITVTRSLPVIQEPEQQVFGLSFPTATAEPPRPTSYLPRLEFSEQLEPAVYVSTPAGSVSGKKSNRAPTVTTEITYPASIGKSQNSSPIYSLSPTIPIPPRSSLRSDQSKLPSNTELSSNTRRTEVSKRTPVAAIPTKSNSQDRKTPARRRPSIADSGYGSPIQKSYAKTKSSDSISLALLTGDSTTSSFPKFEETQTLAEVHMPEPVLRGRNYNPPTSHSRQSSRSLSRTYDSIHRHSRKISRDRSASNRRSKQRDQIYYDPTSHHRNRSGSIQGRAVDFSNPRESPFSDPPSTIYKHSPASSSSSENSIISYYATPQPSIYTPDTLDVEALNVGGEGSKLRYTNDNFGYSAAGGDQTPVVISLRDSAPRQEVREPTVEKIQRLRPVRVSQDGQFLTPGLGSFETHSTSTSPVMDRFSAKVV